MEKNTTDSAQAVDTQSGAVLVELQAANPDGALKPGAYAQVSFDAGAGQATGVALPGSAILYGNTGPTVAVMNGADRVTFSGLAHGPLGLTIRNTSATTVRNPLRFSTISLIHSSSNPNGFFCSR